MPCSISDNDTRLQAIADCLNLPVAVFFDEPASDAGSDDASLDDLRRAYVAAAEAYTQGLHRAAQSVSLAGTV